MIPLCDILLLPFLKKNSFPLYLHIEDNNRTLASEEDACIRAITFGGSYSNHNTETLEEACYNHVGKGKEGVVDIHYKSCWIKDDASYDDFDSH